MKRIFVLLTVLFLITNDGFSQDFFKKEKLIETGVYYYPEAWDSNQWDRDFQNMVKMGFEFTHFTDFAWAILEPSEGQYNFEWLDKAIELAAKHGLKVILCTPTAAPPVWLTKKYPEVLVVRENGQRAMHGTREHYSWSSKKYRELTFIEVLEKDLKILDSTATSLCMENNLPIVVFDITKPGNIKDVVLGKKIGTLVKN